MIIYGVFNRGNYRAVNGINSMMNADDIILPLDYHQLSIRAGG
jgi:hypothetical protein